MKSASENPLAPLGKVLIVGGGSAGWMAAAALSRTVGHTTRLELVESEAIGTVGVGEATIPPIRQFNRFCGIDEAEFLRATGGTFKVGIQFEGWGRPHERYIHPFGRVGQEFDAVVRMHHWWGFGALAHEGEYPRWEDLFLGRAAMDREAFAFDPARANPLLPHAYHFDALRYAAYLRKLAEERGVTRTEGKVASVDRDGERGDIRAVLLDDGRRIEADFFIDCTGFRSLLLGEALGEKFEDWSPWLPADRAVVVQSEPTSAEITPATRAIAHPVGWQWRIPLQHRIGNGHVYASAHSSDEDAEQRLLATVEGKTMSDPRILRFATGRRRRPWRRNVVALGLSAGFLEPLESTSIHLVQSAIERLIELFPSRRIEHGLRARFNAQSAREWCEVRDLIIAHYKVNQRHEPFWRACAAMEVPDSLAETLDLWEDRGALAIDGGHLFQLGSWAAVLIGQNCLPTHIHPLAARATPQDIAPKIGQIAAAMKHQAGALPDHVRFLKRFGAWSTD
ncbi:MAG: tryptophan halogenase family protein [Erythrobacter sp.]